MSGYLEGQVDDGTLEPSALAPILKPEPGSSASIDAEEYLTVQDCELPAMHHAGTRNATPKKKTGTHSEAWLSVHAQYADLKPALGFFLCRTLAHRFRLFDDGLSMPFHASVQSKPVKIEILEDSVIDALAKWRECNFERMVFSNDT